MFFNEYVTKEILNLTSDDSEQKLLLTHRYLLCSYAICRHILNNETDSYLRWLAKPYKNNLMVAAVYMENNLELQYADNVKDRKLIK